MLAPWNILGKCKVDDNQTSIDIYKYDIELLHYSSDISQLLECISIF